MLGPVIASQFCWSVRMPATFECQFDGYGNLKSSTLRIILFMDRSIRRLNILRSQLKSESDASPPEVTVVCSSSSYSNEDAPEEKDRVNKTSPSKWAFHSQ